MPFPISLSFRTSGVRATPGYSLFLLPWAGIKAETGGYSQRNQSSTYLSGGHLNNGSSTQNDQFNDDCWLDTGTYKVALIYRTLASGGIFNIQFDSVLKGTLDGYSVGDTQNVYGEITGIAVPTAKVVNVKNIMATKNASSSSYLGSVQSIALIRTGA